MRTHSPASDPDVKIHWQGTLPYVGVHLMCVFVLQVGAKPVDVAVCAGLWLLRMWGVTAGYHRYFSHRAFQTGRAFQFVLALLGALSMQKGPLWWAANHRHHHRYSDQPEDFHSPVQKGFWWSHMLWILSDRHLQTNHAAVKDFARYPELRWLNRFHYVPGLLLAGALYALGGFSMLVWGFFVSVTLTYNCFLSVNSFNHVFGKRRYKTTDTSRNNWLLALIILGDGWHNNHHYHQNTASHGWFWWEVDLTYCALKVLSWVGLVSELRMPSDEVKYSFLKYTPEERAALASPPSFWEERARLLRAAEERRSEAPPVEKASSPDAVSEAA